MRKTDKYQLVNSPVNNYTAGLTKREYFAAMALQGILSRKDDVSNVIASKAVRYADALIDALNKKSDE